jgi:hypothetical protein
VALLLAVLGFTTASLTIALSFLPTPLEVNPTLEVIKVTGGTAVLLAVGALLYWTGKRRMREAGR